MRPLFKQQNEMLRHIMQKSLQLDQLNKKVQLYLSEDLRPHCIVADFVKGKLSIQVANSAWATQLRYCKMDLLEKLRSEAKIAHLGSIEIFVNAFTAPKLTKTASPPRFINQAIISQLKQQISSIEDDNLRSALNKLADSLGKN